MPVIFRQFLIRLGLISLVKLLGALGKIPLYSMVGAEGIGLYQMAYSFYGLVLTIITFGVPTALSLHSSKDPKQGLALLKKSALILLFVGSSVAILTFQFAPLVVRFFGESHLLWAILAVSPAFVVIPMLSLLRGYLQGLEYYSIIAVSEVVEQVIRVVVMLLCVSLWVDYGVGFAISGATLAASISGIFTLAFLLYFFHQTTHKHIFPIQYTHGELNNSNPFIRSSFLFFLTQLVIPIANFLATMFIPTRLAESGMTIHQATAVLGKYFGMASMIIYIPTLITSALGHVLIVKFCADWEMQNINPLVKKITSALQFVSLWGVCSALFLMYFSREISVLAVGDDSIHFCIFYLSLAPLFSGLQTITTAALWATGNQGGPLLGLIFGSTISLLFYFFLIPVLGFHYIGIIVGFLATDALCTIWNLGSLYKKFRHSHQICTSRGTHMGTRC